MTQPHIAEQVDADALPKDDGGRIAIRREDEAESCPVDQEDLNGDPRFAGINQLYTRMVLARRNAAR